MGGSSGSESEYEYKSKGLKKDKDKKKDKDHKDKDKKDKDKKDKDKKDKDKKDKDKKDKDKDGKDKHKVDHSSASGHGAPAGFPQPFEQYSSPPIVPPSFEANRVGTPGYPSVPPSFPNPSHGAPPFPSAAPGFPSTTHPQANTTAVATAAPPSGYRVPLTTTSPFPDPTVAGQPVCYEHDGLSPLFIGSALFENSVHPCKIGPHLQPFASVAYGGVERGHHGRFDLLPFVPQTMEWVRTSYGQIPPGRRPIEGGYEEHGAKLYHALAVVNGAKVPGKTGDHLSACNVSFGGVEVTVTDYEIL
ncbi:hypothetical protein H0H87_009947 [Tephrocybe sp. NHM501043]|nr:hypothetical protein H0H87_009947 [Tephrocybe sp. NHM501043]